MVRMWLINALPPVTSAVPARLPIDTEICGAGAAAPEHPLHPVAPGDERSGRERLHGFQCLIFETRHNETDARQPAGPSLF